MTIMRWRLGALIAALALALAACGGAADTADPGPDATAPDGGEATGEPTVEDTGADTGADAGEDAGETGELTPVSLQLQWFAQAQFAGYYAAVAEGFYADEGLDVEIVEGGVDIVPQTQLATGAVDFAIAWVPKALASRQEGAAITNIGQIFQRSGTLQVSWADSGISTAADLEGKTVGNWGFGNEFELLAGLRKAGLDPNTDATLVQQQFDMSALLAREIDAAQAMTYNEYAQVLETVNPETGELDPPEDLSVIDWNEEGTAMLQDAIWADATRLSDAAYRDTAVRFLTASLQGWIFCRDNPDDCVEHVLAAGPTLGTSHQTWMMAEINKLIWPSPNGIGVLDQGLWDQTVTVAVDEQIIAEEPEAEAFTTELAEEAVAALEEEGLDVRGEGYTAPEVELAEGGA
ncbi:MAG TPA: ABC transporter substrate-binding protein [Egibacteraceae bacterium]|nr:ABC transporter substrate-binding protein [Egibacteraceae bacterium]